MLKKLKGQIFCPFILGLYFGFDRDKNIYKSLVGNLRNGRKLKLNANTRLQMAA